MDDGFTLPETNSSPLKIDGWKATYYPFGALGLFSGTTVDGSEFLHQLLGSLSH